jgi:hypothetical protein
MYCLYAVPWSFSGDIAGCKITLPQNTAIQMKLHLTVDTSDVKWQSSPSINIILDGQHSMIMLLSAASLNTFQIPFLSVGKMLNESNIVNINTSIISARIPLSIEVNDIIFKTSNTYDKSIVNGEGGLFQISNIRSVILRNVKISGCFAKRGGAMFLHNVAMLSMKSSLFLNNNGVDGGAVFVNSIQSVVVDDCFFYGNEAMNSGGAIAMHGVNSLQISSQNQFTENKAFVFGKIYIVLAINSSKGNCCFTFWANSIVCCF